MDNPETQETLDRVRGVKVRMFNAMFHNISAYCGGQFYWYP